MEKLTHCISVQYITVTTFNQEGNMTDTINRDKRHDVIFDFYIETNVKSSELPLSKSGQVETSGRSWDITLVEPRQQTRPQVIFTAKSGKLFR